MSEALNREYHELLGWHIIDDVGALSGFPPDAENWTWIPRLDQSSDLCIAELDRVFGPDWLTVAIQESYLVAQYTWHDSVTLVIRNVHRGATFNEAALKALIAAHKRDGGEAI